jgi:hypothetical protein
VLHQHGTLEFLSIKTGYSNTKEIQLIPHPDPLGLPRIIEVLRGIHRDTDGKAKLMEQAKRSLGVFSDIERTQMATAYFVQRADLIGYHRMLTVWRDTQPAPSVKRVIGHWLDVIEVNTQAVLGTLVSDKLP